MNAPVCLTVDVEDWYEGMAALGHTVPRELPTERGLAALRRVLQLSSARITLFVVGRHAVAARDDLRALAAAGHEIASHGPDHGHLPEDRAQLGRWLQSGRQMVEDVVQCPVRGFRSPRFDVPSGSELVAYRDAIAGAGFSYVSDRHVLGTESMVTELPVLRWSGMPIGGGSYQRLLPRSITRRVITRHASAVVLYYHSYDFGHELPGLFAARSPAVIAQVLGRKRVSSIFADLIARFGSVTCGATVSAV